MTFCADGCFYLLFPLYLFAHLRTKFFGELHSNLCQYFFRSNYMVFQGMLSILSQVYLPCARHEVVIQPEFVHSLQPDPTLAINRETIAEGIPPAISFAFV